MRSLPDRSARPSQPSGSRASVREAGGLRFLAVVGNMVYLTGSQCRAIVEVTGYPVEQLSPAEQADPLPTYTAVLKRLHFPVDLHVSREDTGWPPDSPERRQMRARGGQDSAGHGPPAASRRLLSRLRALLPGPAPRAVTGPPELRHRFHVILEGRGIEELRARCAELDLVLWRAELSSRRLAGAELERLARRVSWDRPVEHASARQIISTVALAQAQGPSGTAPARPALPSHTAERQPPSLGGGAPPTPPKAPAAGRGLPPTSGKRP